MMRNHFPIIPPLLLAALLALGSCILLTHCSDEPTAPPDTTVPPPPPPRDTTSHEFTWELHKIGDTYGDMRDVWAIDDDFAIVVGRFTWQDSTGKEIKDSTTNAVEIINGIQHKFLVSTDGINRPTMNSCFASTDADMWFASTLPYQRIGEGYVWYLDKSLQYPPWGGYCNKMWGRKNTTDVYVAAGNVIQRVNDGHIKTIVVPYGSPGMGFFDIWGEEDGEVVAAGYNTDNGLSYLYRIKSDNTWEVIHETESLIGGVWGYNGVWYFSDYYTLKTWDGNKIKSWKSGIANPHEIRGNHENDIFLCYGSGGKVLHWNGSTLQYIYNENFGHVSTYGMSVTTNTVYVCGLAQPGQQPVILVGKRKK